MIKGTYELPPPFGSIHTTESVGLGTVITSFVFLGIIIAIVVYMTVMHRGGEVVSENDRALGTS